MLMNLCNTCGSLFPSPKTNPRRFYKYCSNKCRGDNEVRRIVHTRVMRGRIAWNRGDTGLKPWMNISGLSGKGSIPWNKGKHGLHTPEQIAWNRAFHTGRSPGNKGKKASAETRRKLSIAHTGHKGEMCGAWKHGKTTANMLIRGSVESKRWTRAILERDHFTCTQCGKHGGKLNVDHIKPFALYPELRFELSNGRTLCVPCHKQTDTYCGKTTRLVRRTGVRIK